MAGSVAAVAGQKAQHIRNRGFDSQYYRDMIVALVRAHQPERLTSDMEILSLYGTVAFDGVKSSSHLHMALSTCTGQVLGGHVASGCIVRTTAEVLLALLPESQFACEPDSETGFDELVVRVRV